MAKVNYLKSTTLWLLGNRQYQQVVFSILLMLVTLAVYAPVKNFDFLNYDDNIYIENNPALLSGVSVESVRWAFTTGYGANWFPVTWLSWLVDFEVHGLSAGGVHITNVIFHAFSAMVLFLALARLTGAVGRSAFVAGIFALHPTHIESVAWASERKDVLSAFFFGSTLYVYSLWIDRPQSVARIVATHVLFLLGLMSKASLVTLPFLLLCLDYWPLGRMRRGSTFWLLIREKSGLFVIAFAVSAVAFVVQQKGGTVVSDELLPLGVRIANAAQSYWIYIVKTIWPTQLAVFHPHPEHEILYLKSAVMGCVLIGSSLIAWILRVQFPYLLIGLMWFFGVLVPMIGLVQVGSQGYAERYLYLSQSGLIISFTWAFCDLCGRKEVRWFAVILILSLCAWRTHVELPYWENSETLFARALEVTEKNHIAHIHYAESMVQKGKPEVAKMHYRSALKVDPQSAKVANNLAWLLATHPDSSVAELEEAVQLASKALSLMGENPIVLDTLASSYAALGQFGKALVVAQRAYHLAVAEGDYVFSEEIRKRLELYRGATPYREQRLDSKE